MYSTSSSQGQCPRCGDDNPYTGIVCSGCYSRLPWADAVIRARQHRVISPSQAKPPLLSQRIRQSLNLLVSSPQAKPPSPPLPRCCSCRNPLGFTPTPGQELCPACSDVLAKQVNEERQLESATVLSGNLPDESADTLNVVLRRGEQCHYLTLAILLQEKVLGRTYIRRTA
jgi:hypothetical protein